MHYRHLYHAELASIPVFLDNYHHFDDVHKEKFSTQYLETTRKMIDEIRDVVSLRDVLLQVTGYNSRLKWIVDHLRAANLRKILGNDENGPEKKKPRLDILGTNNVQQIRQVSSSAFSVIPTIQQIRTDSNGNQFQIIINSAEKIYFCNPSPNAKTL